jgi:hypothetical protein
MLFGEEADWKELLSAKAQAELAELIEKAKVHRCAYMQADDVKVAQLWAAMTELSLEMKRIEKKVDKMEIVTRAFRNLGDNAKREAIKERVSDIFKPKTASEKEEVDRIVDSLMQF